MRVGSKKYEELRKIFILLKIELARMVGNEGLANILHSSLHQQAQPSGVFCTLYLTGTKKIDKDYVCEILLKYLRFAESKYDGLFLERVKQVLGEYSVLLTDPKTTTRLFGEDIIKSIAGFKNKTDRTLLIQGEILLSGMIVDKHCLDIVLHWIHTTCRGQREAMRIKRMMIWYKACKRYVGEFINHKTLTPMESLILIHLHEELSRMAFALTDTASYGSALNAICNDKTSIPTSIMYKRMVSGKMNDDMRYTSLYRNQPPENTKGLIIKGKYFTMVLHNGKYNHVSSNHINGLMQAMWEVTGKCYVEKNTHRHLGKVFTIGKDKYPSKKEDFITRLNELSNPNYALFNPTPINTKFEKFEDVDVVADYEASEINSINDTMDFLLSALKDMKYHTKV